MYTMKESVAVAKEADAKKGVSATKSDNSILRLRNEPERQLGSLRGVIGNIRRDGGTPSVESIAMQLSGMHTTQRAPVLLALQHTHGNRYVQRVVAGVQAKLAVGQPGDIYEQEADRVAEQVMRMAEPQVQRQPEKEEESVQQKRTDVSSQDISQSVAARIKSIKGGGSPLSNDTRSFFEPIFGSDLSKVRVHSDSHAAETAKVIGAKAFTIGQDVVFGAGQYSPHTMEGKKLMAHELTHVVQQKGRTVLQPSARRGQSGKRENREDNHRGLGHSATEKISGITRISQEMINCVPVELGLDYDIITHYEIPGEGRMAHRVLIDMAIEPETDIPHISNNIIKVLRRLLMTVQADRAPGLVQDDFFQQQLTLHRAAYRQTRPGRRSYTIPVILHRDAASTEDPRGYMVNRIEIDTRYGPEPEAPGHEQRPEPIPPQREERDAWLVAARVDTQRLSEAARNMLIQYPNLHPEYLPRPRVRELQSDGRTSLNRVRNAARLYDPNIFIRTYLYTPITRDYDHFCQRVQGFRGDVRASAQRIMAETTGCETCLPQSCIIIKEEWYFPLQPNAHSVYHFSFAGT